MGFGGGAWGGVLAVVGLDVGGVLVVVSRVVGLGFLEVLGRLGWPLY